MQAPDGHEISEMWKDGVRVSPTKGGMYDWDATVGTIEDGYMQVVNEPKQNAIVFTKQNNHYGHNVQQGTMFGSLRRYREATYYSTHPAFTLITAEAVYNCKIFSIRTANAHDSSVYTTDFADAATYADFLAGCKAASLYEVPVTPRPEIPMITLSTCTGRDKTERFVIQATLEVSTPLQPQAEAGAPKSQPTAQETSR